MKIKMMILITFLMASVMETNAQECPCNPDWGCKKITIKNDSDKKLSLTYHLCCNKNPDDWSIRRNEPIKPRTSFSKCFHLVAAGFELRQGMGPILISKSFSNASDIVCSNQDKGVICK
jgi:hypothetical protein